MTCVDAATGGPARAEATGRPLACEPGRAPAAAERQEGTYRDTFDQAAGPAPRCDPRRLRAILASGRDAVSVDPRPADDPARPRITAADLARRQAGALHERDTVFALRLIGVHAAEDAALHGVVHAAGHRVAAGGAGMPTRAIGAAGVPGALALAVYGAIEVQHYLGERAEMVEAQQRALGELRDAWRRYECDHSLNSLAIVRNRTSQMEQGARLALEGRLDDPFVQQRLAESPYLRLGASIALEHAEALRAEAEANRPPRASAVVTTGSRP